MNIFFKIVFVLILLIVGLYLYLHAVSQKTYPVTYGISFNQHHAEDLGLDWREVYTHMLQDLQPEYIRIAAMWNDVESEEGVFDYERVDWMMDQAREAGTKVTLVVGQKAPRWPECHVPDWYDVSAEGSENLLLNYVKHTVERYKNHEALALWQVENEPFIHFQFGECENFDDSAVHTEIELVRELDPEHPIIVTDSGELGLWSKAGKAGDLFGTTLYRIVRAPNGNIITYDWVPAAFYRYKAAFLGIHRDRFMVAELQAEPWFNNSNPTDTPIEEQEKTMNPKRLTEHMNYTERIGVSRADLWGVEWWYFMKKINGDERYWNIVKENLENGESRN